MKEAILVYGATHSGKSTLARNYLDFKFINADSMIDYAAWQKREDWYPTYLKRIEKAAEGEDKVILDIFPVKLDPAHKLFDSFFRIKAKVIVTIAPLYVIKFRYIRPNRPFPTTYPSLVDSYYLLEPKSSYPLDEDFSSVTFFDTTDYNLKELDFKTPEDCAIYWEQINKKPTKEAVAEFLEDLKSINSSSYQSLYQDIELPFNLGFKGPANSSQTWENIKDLVSYKNKRVCDFGCYHGYFCSKVLEAGASHVAGIDVHKGAIKTAKRIRHLKQSPIAFLQADLNVLKIPFFTDISLILNCLHHIKRQDFFLSQVFARTREAVILEINPFEVTLMESLAHKFGFEETIRKQSHRSSFDAQHKPSKERRVVIKFERRSK